MVKQGEPDYGKGGEDRRLHIIALTAWQERLVGRRFPKPAEFQPSDFPELAGNSFVLDVTGDIDEPLITYAGAAIDEECGGDLKGRLSTDLGSDTVFFHLVDHFVEVIANRLPIGFEAEYDRADGSECRYRGVLLPLSEDGEDVDFIVGVLNWIEK